jgi:YVTN family beta-propeller protein
MGSSKFLAIAVAAGGLLAGALGGAAGAAPATAKVYVSNADDSSVAVIDVATQSILTTIDVGTEPRNLAVTPDGDTVYVPNRWSDSVSVISTATDTVTTTVTDATTPGCLVLPCSFDDPYAVSVSPDGSRAWVANKEGGGSSTGSVTVIDTATNTVSSTIDNACFSSPEGIVATASTVYVVNRGADNVCPIDSTTLAVGSAIAVGEQPRFAVVTPDGSALYVSNNGDETGADDPPCINGSVSKIATATNTVTATISTGGCPRNLAILADGSKVYVPLQTDAVAIIATATDTFTTLPIAGADSTYGVAISQVEGLAYVTDEELDAVWVIDTSTDSVVSTPGLASGFDTPRANVAVAAATTTTTTTVAPTTVAPTTVAPTTVAPATTAPPPATLPATGSSPALLLLAFAAMALGTGAVVVASRR